MWTRFEKKNIVLFFSPWFSFFFCSASWQFSFHNRSLFISTCFFKWLCVEKRGGFEDVVGESYVSLMGILHEWSVGWGWRWLWKSRIGNYNNNETRSSKIFSTRNEINKAFVSFIERMKLISLWFHSYFFFLSCLEFVTWVVAVDNLTSLLLMTHVSRLDRLTDK